MEKEVLLIDCCSESSFTLELMESTVPGGLMKFRGKFQEANAVNKNKRIYPFSVLDENIKRLMEAVNDRRLIGELDHPTDTIVHFANASHLITKLWWGTGDDHNTLYGEGEILNTPHGKVLKALLNDGVKIGISSRGVGSGKVNEQGIFEIGNSYKLITFDAVADPSTFSAFQEKVVTSSRPKNEANLQNSYEMPVKNESTSISKVSKDVLVAYLGGVIKSQVQDIKTRLS